MFFFTSIRKSNKISEKIIMRWPHQSLSGLRYPVPDLVLQGWIVSGIRMVEKILCWLTHSLNCATFLRTPVCCWYYKLVTQLIGCFEYGQSYQGTSCK